MFYGVLRLRKLSDLNYLFQDNIILCEVFENRATQMIKKFSYNPRKCTSVSSLSGCINQYLSKVIISLPTKSEFVDVFDKFSRVNTRLASTQPFYCRRTKWKQEKKLNMIYKIRNKENDNYEEKRLVAKTLKMDESNQYGNAMTKSLPTDNINRSKKTPTLRGFTLLIEGILDEDKIGHLFLVDIEFSEQKASEKHLLFNQIYTPIFEKKKVLPSLKGPYSN